MFTARSGPALPLLFAISLSFGVAQTGVARGQTVDGDAPQDQAESAEEDDGRSSGGLFGGEGNFVSDDEPIDISADELELDQEKKVAIFTGNVDAVQGTLNLKSEELIIYYTQSTDSEPSPEEESGGRTNIRQIDARGNVRLATVTETASGDWAIYKVGDGVITLGGKVTLTRGENILQGAKLIVDVETGNSRLLSSESGEQRVRGLFVPGSEDEGDDQEASDGTDSIVGRQSDG